MAKGHINRQHFTNEEIRALLGKALYDGYRTSTVQKIVPDRDGWVVFAIEHDRQGNTVYQEGYQMNYDND